MKSLNEIRSACHHPIGLRRGLPEEYRQMTHLTTGLSGVTPVALPDTELGRRLAAFQFDNSDQSQPFSRRLANEQGWSREFALRAVEEYRRFLYLAISAGHPVCPSEEVDEVWHLHLVFTRSYWHELCQDVLQKPLHHAPTEGGPAELRKHWQMYRDTLA
ncbi:MAG: hypothetical protein KDA92_21260, partial [Planctomycetales bacterium]|nr:hypothetical protein [Planctomycetales bacterium]